MDMDFEHKHDQNPVHSVEDNGVDYLLEREERNWDANLKWEDILSLGEQQRLGMICKYNLLEIQIEFFKFLKHFCFIQHAP